MMKMKSDPIIGTALATFPSALVWLYVQILPALIVLY
jgi:hypothetical protein